MTLASRLSTQVNLGKIHDKASVLNAVLGNFALTQVKHCSIWANKWYFVLIRFKQKAQAIVVGFLASMFALSLEFIKQFTSITTESEQANRLDFKNSLVLISGSMSTASFASLILAGLMMFVIIISKKVRINPDNVATPIAGT